MQRRLSPIPSPRCEGIGYHERLGAAQKLAHLTDRLARERMGHINPKGDHLQDPDLPLGLDLRDRAG